MWLIANPAHCLLLKKIAMQGNERVVGLDSLISGQVINPQGAFIYIDTLSTSLNMFLLLSFTQLIGTHQGSYNTMLRWVCLYGM